MKKTVLVLGCFCATLLSTALVFMSCASILGGGTKQDIQISSSPGASNVKIERSVAGARQSVWDGTTPATVKLKRKHEYVVTVSLEGYQPAEVLLEHGTNGWVWGNILCGGVIGLIVDFTNGAAKKLVPGEVNVQLLTAMGPQLDRSVYAVFSTLDSNGQLRLLPVPLIPDNQYLSAN